MPRHVLSAAVSALAILSAPVYAHHASAPDTGKAFEPRPVSQPLYDIQSPDADPERQRHYVIVTADDGTETKLFTETWLPAPKDGQVPPARMPVVLTLSPYATVGQLWDIGADRPIREALVRRGYAVTQAHMRGTGASEGCVQMGGPVDRDDGARIVEYLGRDAPWSDGNVGMHGHSQSGMSQFNVAISEDRARVKYLKAIVPGAPNTSQYAFVHADGVPFLLGPQGIWSFGQNGATSLGLLPTSGADVQDRLPRAVPLLPQRANCPTLVEPWLESSGDFSAHWSRRETRRDLHRVTAAVLLSHGISDRRVSVASISGVLDALPVTTPWAAVFGWWQHDMPNGRAHDGWRRADWDAMVIAWFDRYLKNLPSGVETWPRVQVQDSAGQWRSEDTWPRPAGEFGQLALSASADPDDPTGVLGAAAPTGASTYVEEPPATAAHPDDPPGTSLVFETAPVSDRLELSGEPVLDLWLMVDLPAANIAAKLEALGPDRKLTMPEARTNGLRSVRHLEPLHNGAVFVQEQGVDPPLNEPIRVQLRLRPTQLVVPKGGSLRLTIGGSPGLHDVLEALMLPIEGPHQPSGLPTRITVLHDCAHPSALRFTLPRRRPNLLNVREEDEADAPLASTPGALSPDASGGGLATAEVCGHPPSSPYAELGNRIEPVDERAKRDESEPIALVGIFDLLSLALLSVLALLRHFRA